MASLVKSIKLLPWCISSAVQLAATTLLGENDPATTVVPKLEESSTPDSLSSLTNQYSFSLSTSPVRSPFCGHFPSGVPICKFLAIYTQKKQACSCGSSLNHHHSKRTHIDFQEVQAANEHSSALGSEGMYELILGTGTIFEQQG